MPTVLLGTINSVGTVESKAVSGEFSISFINTSFLGDVNIERKSVDEPTDTWEIVTALDLADLPQWGKDPSLYFYRFNCTSYTSGALQIRMSI